MGQTGGKQSGGGPDTPWTVDHNAAGFNLLNLLHLGPKSTGQLPTFINAAANLTPSWNIAGQGSDLLGVVAVDTVAAFAGAAADTILFEVQLFSAHSSVQCIPFIIASQSNALPFQCYGLVGTVAFGFGSFKVLNHAAIPAGLNHFVIAYFCPGG